VAPAVNGQPYPRNWGVVQPARIAVLEPESDAYRLSAVIAPLHGHVGRRVDRADATAANEGVARCGRVDVPTSGRGFARLGRAHGCPHQSECQDGNDEQLAPTPDGFQILEHVSSSVLQLMSQPSRRALKPG